MGWFGKLLGTDDAVKQVLETGKELLDDAFYTDAEEAQHKQESAKEVRGMIVDWMKNTQGQNLSRRVIALATTGTWLLMFIIATVLSVSAVWVDPEVSALVTASTAALDARLEILTTAVLLILGFYFGAPKLSEISEVFVKRFSNKS